MPYSLTNPYVWKEVGGQVVILHVDSGVYWTLNGTASLIWKGVMKSMTQPEIIQWLCSEYDIDKDTAVKDTEEMIQSFLNNKMLLAN